MAKRDVRVLAYYDGKVVDVGAYVQNPKQWFSIACMRVVDNVPSGYVVDGEKVYYLTRSSRMAKRVRGEEAARVLAAVQGG